MSVRAQRTLVREWKTKYSEAIDKFLTKEKFPKNARKEAFQFIVRWEFFRLSKKI